MSPFVRSSVVPFDPVPVVDTDCGEVTTSAGKGRVVGGCIVSDKCVGCRKRSGALHRLLTFE